MPAHGGDTASLVTHRIWLLLLLLLLLLPSCTIYAAYTAAWLEKAAVCMGLWDFQE